MNVAAQKLSFEADYTFRDKVMPVHRAVPFWADFNNDGKMDIYYGGTSCVNGWICRGILLKNMGNGAFEMEDSVNTETYMEDVTDSLGNVSQVEKTRVTGMYNGLPYTAYGMGSLAIDYNQDGLVDFLFLNRGGNNNNTSTQHKGIVLVKNLGNYMFQVVPDSVLKSINFGNDDSSYNEDNEIGSLAVGDYDRDGYPDILVEGVGDGRFVKLLRNVNGDHFEMANVFNPLPWDVESNKKGVYVQSPSTIDEEGIEQPGSYTQVPTMQAKPMSHGGVTFGDFDGDGWLDIVTSGWVDSDASDVALGEMPGGDNIRFYRNLRNGQFQDVTNQLCNEGEGVEDVFKRWGNEDCMMSVVDYNQDGKPDLLMVGSMRDRSAKQAIVLINGSDNGKFSFSEETTGIAPIAGLGCRGFLVADMNGDDYVDVYGRGWTSYEGYNNWDNAFSLSTGAGSYNIQWFRNDNPGGFFSETLSFGDANGDGQLDVLSTGWTDRSDDVIMNTNKSGFTMQAPAVPENLAAEANDSVVTVKWNEVSLPSSAGAAMYNVYIKDANGNVKMLVPANEATGFQKAYMPFYSYVLSGNGEPSFSFYNLPEGTYTVGVQSVSYSYAASPFATISVAVTGIEPLKGDNTQLAVSVKNNTLVASGAANGQVKVYTADGKQVASGLTNAPLLLNGNGIFIVKVNNKVVKIVK